MRAIAIDDEQLALEHFSMLINEFPQIELIGSYQNSLAALQAISEYRPNVVFIDIEMPGLSGIQIAKEIQNEIQDIHVVFVTAFQEYAVEAFEINAVDYLVKPIRKERLAKTIERIEEIDIKLAGQNLKANLISCFGELSFYVDRKREVPTWRTRRAEEVFHYLLHHRDHYVSRELILQEFWPEMNLTNAQAQLYTTIYQIRRTLEAHNLPVEIINTDQKYRFITKDVALDVELWEEGLKGFTTLTKDNVHDLIQILDLYEGHYFENKGYLWAESERENLRSLWLSYMIEVIDILMKDAQYPVALRLVQQLKEIEPFEETGYLLKMKIYAALQKGDLVRKEFAELKDMLAEEMDDEVSQDIADWYETWKQKISY